MTPEGAQPSLKGMKVVLLHDWLTGMRGGERVLEAFCEIFPEAPIYSLIHKPGSTSPVIDSHEIKTSFLNRIPGIYENYRKFLPLFPTAADSINITEKPALILSSSHCVIKAVKKPAGSRHISYIHSPMRYIYDQFDAYFGPTAPLSQRLVAPLIRGYLTRYDLESNRNVDGFIANSEFVRDRIRKFYDREANVVHPFVDLVDFSEVAANPPPRENYFLMVSAFAPNKHVEVAIRAFNELGKKLVIVGSGQQENYLRSMAGPTIEFKGSCSRKEIIQLFARAQAFIFPGVEDFGITPLESLAAGTPVIALHAGGVLETLNDDVADFFEGNDTVLPFKKETTVNLNEPTDSNFHPHSKYPKTLTEAVRRFKPARFDRTKLLARAAEFSKDTFKRNIISQLAIK